MDTLRAWLSKFCKCCECFENADSDFSCPSISPDSEWSHRSKSTVVVKNQSRHLIEQSSECFAECQSLTHFRGSTAIRLAGAKLDTIFNVLYFSCKRCSRQSLPTTDGLRAPRHLWLCGRGNFFSIGRFLKQTNQELIDKHLLLFIQISQQNLSAADSSHTTQLQTDLKSWSTSDTSSQSEDTTNTSSLSLSYQAKVLAFRRDLKLVSHGSTGSGLSSPDHFDFMF